MQQKRVREHEFHKQRLILLQKMQKLSERRSIPGPIAWLNHLHLL